MIRLINLVFVSSLIILEPFCYSFLMYSAVTLFLLSHLLSILHLGLPADSGSARYKADQMAKMVQARISANRTSQSIDMGGGLSIYSREPNRKSSVFIGNLTWVSNSCGWGQVAVAPFDKLCVCVCAG